jgi:hypothetical protein
MEINVGNEAIIELQAVYSAQQIQDRANAKRIDAFGTMAKLLQRPKFEDIEVTTTQKRYEPFWYGVATAHYVYDRRHTLYVQVAPEVQSVTFHEQDYPVTPDHGRSFSLDAVEHCSEQIRRELILNAQDGNEGDFKKYLAFQKQELENMDALERDGALVVQPETRGSFVVRKLVSQLVKTFQADKIFEERIDVEQVALYFHPIYAIEYFWKTKTKKQVVEFDALTGDMKAEGGEIKKHVAKVLENDTLFDIGADTIGTVLPGANIAVKLGRLGLRKVVK